MERRTTTLMAILLVLLAVLLLRPQLEAFYYSSRLPGEDQEPPLSGANAISSLQIKKDKNGTYTAHVEYFYRGDPPLSFLHLVAEKGDSASKNYNAKPTIIYGNGVKAKRGRHAIDVEIQRPPMFPGQVITRRVVAALGHRGAAPDTWVYKNLDFAIEWPDYNTYYARKHLFETPTEKLYKESVSLIDQGSVSTAKRNLEQILLREPNHIPALVELARVAMKSNWGPEGLRQGEKYLLSALALDNKHANTKVLLGYVYAHQGRYKEAEAELKEAAEIGTPNLWLWANWGELLLVQGKNDLALEKYMRAVSGGRTYDTYDRARIDAYYHLFAILEKKKDFEKMDTLYQKRAEEFANRYSCFFGDYGRFRLTHYGDYQAGIANSKKAIDEGCHDNEVRATLGMSYYVAWLNGNGDEKIALINQARAFLPEGPRLLYELATSDETSKVIPELLKTGSSIREKDNNEFNALAYSFYQRDWDAVKRLVDNGAKFDDPVGNEQYPVALIPILKQDIAGILVMKEIGVRFSEIEFNGLNAFDYAKNTGNPEVIATMGNDTKYAM